ncbi:MAG: hypothetical protein ACM30G_00095 [Micromonosporaceae bacterium]
MAGQAPHPRRVAVAVLAPPTWTPPGIAASTWREALAEDVLDVLATLAEVEAAVAVEAAETALTRRVGWPGLPAYAMTDLTAAALLPALAADGYHQAVLLPADAPDLPAMLIAKLLRPLGTRPVAAAPVIGGPGLLGLGVRLPAPAWLPALGLDELTVATLREAAPGPGEVAVAPGWHRLRGPADLGRLDWRLAGWEATRALLPLST